MKHSILPTTLASASLAALLTATPAFAQTQTPTGQPTREEIQRDLLERQLQTEGQAVAIEQTSERAPCPLAGPQFADLKFTFTGADFSGLEGVDGGIVAPAYTSLTGQELSVAAICDIRDSAAAILRDAGYLAAVRVPVQEIDDGRVSFDVVLARMTSVQIRGDAGRSAGALQQYVDRLAEQPVFNIDQAERYLLLARDIPGLDVRLVMQPASREAGGQPGDVVGIFNVTRDPVQFDATVQNFGSKAVGQYGGFGRVRFNGLTGLADQTTISAYATAEPKEQSVIQAGHEMRLGAEGFMLGATATFAWSQPDVAGPDVFESDTFIATVYGAYPFKRTQTSNLYGRVGLEWVDQDVEFTDLPLSSDSLRIAFARLEFNAIDEASLSGANGYSSIEPLFGLAGSLEVRQGLSFLGASEACGPGFINCTPVSVIPPSRLDGDPTALVIRAEAQIDMRPDPELLVRLRPRFQYSPDALLSYEQVSGGNYTSGRGFDPGSIIGDSGYGGQVEFAFGSLIPDVPGGESFQPYAFFDIMAVSTKNVPGDPQTIMSAGGGIRASLGQRLFLDVFGAVPLKRAPFQTERGDVRLLATISVQL